MAASAVATVEFAHAAKVRNPSVLPHGFAVAAKTERVRRTAGRSRDAVAAPEGFAARCTNDRIHSCDAA